MKDYLMKLWRSLFPHEKGVRYVLTAFVLLLLAAFATQCRAEAVVFDAGVQYLRGPAAAVTMHVETDGPRDTVIETGLFLVGSVDTTDRKQDGVMGLQTLIVDGFGNLDLGLGVAYMNRQHEQLGSQLNFAMLVRWHFNDRWALTVRHWSNAGTTDNNTGIDIVTVGYRF